MIAKPQADARHEVKRPPVPVTTYCHCSSSTQTRPGNYCLESGVHASGTASGALPASSRTNDSSATYGRNTSRTYSDRSVGDQRPQVAAAGRDYCQVAADGRDHLRPRRQRPDRAGLRDATRQSPGLLGSGKPVHRPLAQPGQDRAAGQLRAVVRGVELGREQRPQQSVHLVGVVHHEQRCHPETLHRRTTQLRGRRLPE